MLLVFSDTRSVDGHEADFRSALARALDKVSYTIFSDIPKTPENIFSAMIGGILFSDAVLLDGELLNGTSSNALIQYGICYALNKKCMFVSIKNNSQAVSEKASKKPIIIDGLTEFACYLDFATQFKLVDWLNLPSATRIMKPNKLAVHSFIVFGVDRWENPILYDIISNFSLIKEWTPRFVSNIGALSRLDALAKAVSQRSFSVFCLDKNDPDEIFLGIGLAIGMGRPFLVIKNKNIELPASLSGYNGVVEFESYNQLQDKLSKYEGNFLSDEIFEWEGATYNDLLVKLEKQIGYTSVDKLNNFESVLLTINSVLGETTAKPFALLGEVYREKNRSISPDNIDFLVKAKEYYERALSIQKEYQLYQNAVVVIDKHIQIIELIKEKKYRSIPALINLLGGELKGNHYMRAREYLVSVVSELVERRDYVNAISLLSAMQLHDKSEEIQKLVHQVLNLAPLEIIKALQDTQKYVIELEMNKSEIDAQIHEKESLLSKKTGDLVSTAKKLKIAQEDLEKIRSERDELILKLKDISSQLNVFYETIRNFESEIESAKTTEGRGVIVNFGYGWAIYKAVSGEPYILRKDNRLKAEKGLILHSGDIVYDEDGSIDFLPTDAIVVKPDNSHYEDVSYLINTDD